MQSGHLQQPFEVLTNILECFPTEEEQPQNGEHGLPTVTIPWWHTNGGVHTTNDQGGANISVSDEVAGLMPGARGGYIYGFPSDAPP